MRSKSEKKWMLWGLVLMVTGVLLGAFGAHALKPNLSTEAFQSYQSAVLYQVLHALALLILSGKTDLFQQKNLPYHLLILGTLLFSGSIYLLTLCKILTCSLSFVWILTPLGGTLLLLAWSLFIVRLWRPKSDTNA